MVTLTELSMPEVRIREQRHVRVGLEHVGQIGLLDFPGDIDMIRVRGRRGRGSGKKGVPVRGRKRTAYRIESASPDTPLSGKRIARGLAFRLNVIL